MKILYVVKGLSLAEPLGVMQLSAITKAGGHKSVLGVMDQDDIPGLIAAHGIGLAAFSMLSTEAAAFWRLAKKIRRRFPDLPIIAGGPHPTYFPQIIDDWPVDAVVRGEGDRVILPILDALENSGDLSLIPNVHTKKRKNDLLPLVDDLDELPFADRELLLDRTPLKHVPMKTFMATRGCPYHCTYCFNNAYKSLYRGRGKLVRRRSVENLIREIEEVNAASPMAFIRFGDDVFVADNDAWLREFVKKYRRRVGIPFYCLIRPNLVTREIASALKYAGCRSVSISLETGNERLRRQVLKRNISDAALVKAYAVLNDAGINTFSNCMLGLPGARIEDELASCELTFKCRPTYASFTVFTPFPGTRLYDYCISEGHIDAAYALDAFPASTFETSMLKTVTETEKDVHRNIMMLGALANWQPWLRKLILNWAVYQKPNRLFDAVGFLVRNFLQRKIWPVKLGPMAFLRTVYQVYRIDGRNYRKTAGSGKS